MSNELEVYEADLPVFAADNLIELARQAEARIDAVIAIKRTALKVTNVADWTDQNGKPYIMASGAEKIANLFNISWRIEEPVMDTEEDGTITYTYKGRFSLAGRSIEVEGSRSSRDEFFKKYIWDNGKKVGEKPLDRRDLKMAALTNLLGNGITRLLGIRNLTWADLEQFANIKKDQVGKVEYKKAGQKTDIKEPGAKEPTNGHEIKEPDAPATDPQKKAIHSMLGKLGVKDDAKHGFCEKLFPVPTPIASMNDLTKGQAGYIIDKLNNYKQEDTVA